MLIYKVINVVNNKIYIGKTSKTLDKRKKHHLFCAQNNKYGNIYFYNAIRKYGVSNFKWEIVAYCHNEEDLNRQEKYWIKKFNSINHELGYNINIGGCGGDNITYHPKRDEILKKMSKSLKGRIFSKEWIEKIRKANIGKKRSETCKKLMSQTKKKYFETHIHHLKGKKCNLTKEQRIQIGERSRLALTGRITTEATRKKLSIANLGKHPTLETIEKIRKGNLGKKLSNETKKKISEGHKIKVPSDILIKIISSSQKNSFKEIQEITGYSRPILRRILKENNIKKKIIRNKIQYDNRKKGVHYIYNFISPEGISLNGITAIKDFCKEHYLIYISVIAAIQNNRKYKGWQINRFKKNEYICNKPRYEELA